MTAPPTTPGDEETRPTPRIDPRFARRWTQVRREQGRRRLRVLLVLAAAAVVVGGLAGSLWTPLWNVRHVRVSAAGVAPSEVRSLAGLARPRPMIEVDTSAIRARLDAIPRFGGAQVSRSWPATVRISVRTRQPAAAVPLAAPLGPGGAAEASAGWAVVDETGRVLTVVDAVAPGLPIIDGAGPPPAAGGWLAGSPGPAASVPGPGGALAPVNVDAAADNPAAPSGIGAALAVAALLPAGVRPEVASITVGPGGALTMAVLPATISVGSIAVTLGDGSQLAAKVTALATLLAQADLSGVGRLDLTVPDRPAALTARQSPGTVSTLAGG